MKELTSEELKQVQIDIMKYVHNFCEKNSIKYFICSGTLIGAVRHKGFIPWDDDIDIMMPREDYERFIKLFSNEDGKYKVWSHKLQRNYPNSYAKVTDETTVKYENALSAIEMGVDIDVFPLDDIPDDDTEAEEFIKECKRYYDLMTFKKVRLRKDRSLVKNFALFVGRLGLMFYPFHKMLANIDKHAQKYNGCGGSRSADAVYCMAGMKELHKKEWFEETIGLPFENEVFKAPKGFDLMLSTRYGNYMQLPPKDKQITHHDFKAYWRDEKVEDDFESRLSQIDPSDFTN